PLTDITNRLSGADIIADLENVMSSLQPTEQEVDTVEGNTYLMRILPYRTSEDHINGVVITFVEITARKKAEEDLRASEERMRAMFSQAKAGVVVTDLNGVITMVNNQFCKILGYQESDLLGKGLTSFIQKEDFSKNKHLLEQLLSDGKAFDIEQRYICSDESSCWLHNSATIIHARNGRVQAVLHIFIDINTSKIAELNKDNFIGIASHELKTPVTSLKAYAE